jgi:hypothetical protein
MPEDSVYYLRITGEADAGATAGLQVRGARVIVLVPPSWI